MPTAARMLSAIYLAVLAFVVTDMIVAAMLVEEPDLNFGRFREINVFISASVGWILLGSRVGNPYSVATGLGITAVAAAIFWCIFAHSILEMLELSLNRKFDGPMEALVGAVELGVGYSAELLRANIIVTLVLGGIVAGLFAEFVSRRWS
ncbi:TrgA family protein [Lentibacter sp. XHP0401]|uniref:TrgA family protein n=1 Tax=Lentibacter sp. XHP0401 TaxID=2984334 RepID=UPI0021E6FC61|nr:TrgA family protein [Lentibacter sp. XHP0401]MCV2892218.1 TrgA family protein [Lentibacter sp. XHP0401]